MATEMTLTLKLSGISQLIQSIQALNNALNIVNSKFNNVATNIGKAAQQISHSAQQLKASGMGVGSSRRSVIPGAGPNLQQFDQQHLGSVLFSAIAGAWDIMGAKIGTRIASMFAQKWLANHPLNPGRPGITSNPINAGQKWADFLTQLGNKFLLAGVIIFAFVKAVEMAISIFKSLIQGIMSYGQLLFSKGGYTVSGELKGIAAGFGMDAKDVSAQANRTPGGAKAFIQKLKALREVALKNPDLATYMAENMGLGDFLPGLATKSNRDFNKMFTKNPVNPSDVKAAVDFNAALGDFKQSLIELGIALTPVITHVNQLIKRITAFVDAIKWFLDQTFNRWIKQFNDYFKEDRDKRAKSADKFSDAVNKFSDAAGIYGGGERARNAAPRGWGRYNYQNEMINEAEKLGAFEF